MKWALKLGNVAGIGIFVHWTFFLLMGWILYSDLADGESISEALEGVAFVVAIFGCIVLHELGHALTALRFGIRTRDITLLPIGGVARLDHIPDDPMQEFLVAIAGPAVNIVIAMVLMVIIVAMAGFAQLSSMSLFGGSFLTRLLLVNLGLVVFNMIPAFPMDGGRVLRALLSPMMGRLRATDTAATVGQIIALIFAGLGFFGNGMLILIALFVYLGAQQEAQMAHIRAILEGIPVRNAMVTTFRTFSATDLLETAIDQSVKEVQKDFPVMQDGQLVGMLRGKSLIDIKGQANPRTRVADVMQRDCKVVEENAMLQDVFAQMQQDDCSTLPVVQKGRLVGIVSVENIGQWLMVQAARKARGFSNDALPPNQSV